MNSLDKINSVMVNTNVGPIPIEEYRDIIARQNGFDDYEDMYSKGFRIGNQYDKEEK